MREILIEFLRQILSRDGCLVVNLNGQILFFEDYTYISESEKILISDDDNSISIEGNIEVVSHSSNSLQISTTNGTMLLELL